ncbi:MAG: hypothetical protein D6776_03160 [Planctomycetota bacterium]|nr:MAG: hypothetical protein D6776_03160 [Planctomycetota bacterium]
MTVPGPAQPGAARHHRPLPPLRALAPVDRARWTRSVERALARAGADSGLPRWGARWGLEDEAAERLLELVGPVHGPGLGVWIGEDPAVAVALTRSGAAPVWLVPSLAAALAAQRLAERAREEGQRALEAQLARLAREQQQAGWWAGAGPASPAAEPPPLAVPPLAVADPLAPPLAPGRWHTLVAVDVLPGIDDWERAVAGWAQALAPEGRLVLGSVSERDQDAPGFLSLVARTLWPGLVSGLPRSQDLTWVLHAAGLRVLRASVLRLRLTHQRLVALGADREALERVLAEASESARAAYEIDEEGMTWRYQMLEAQRIETN